YVIQTTIQKGSIIRLSNHLIFIYLKIARYKNIAENNLLEVYHFSKYVMRNIKKGQTYPVYSVSTNRAFNRIQLLVQSWESKSHCTCHFLIILLLSYVIYFTIAIITSF